VALALAAACRPVWAVDSDHALVAELGRRAAADGLAVETQVQDCRALDLPHRFGLAIAPMQLVQLLGGPRGRLSFMSRTWDHLLPGGRLAMAIVEDVPPGLLATDEEPLPDVREIAGTVYSSTPVRAGVSDGSLEVHRLRQAVAPDGGLREEQHVDRLDLVNAGTIEAEAEACGLRPRERRDIPAGTHHVGSTVVVLERGA
jgi:hypothetical protein